MVVDESIQLQTSPKLILVANSSLHELINAMDEAIATILHLAEHGPALDDGGPVYFPNCIEILSLITNTPVISRSSAVNCPHLCCPDPMSWRTSYDRPSYQWGST
jgi:hypothetical protein